MDKRSNPMKNPLIAALILIFSALGSAAWAQEEATPAGDAGAVAAGSGKASLPDKRKKLMDAADFVRSLSEDDYKDVSRGIMHGYNPHMRYFASRSAALGSVYGTLAALDYHEAENAGLPTGKAEEASSSYKTLTKDLDALAVNPETLSESGWWQNFDHYINQQPAYPYRNTNAIAGVRGGRKIETEADRKTAKLNESLKKINSDYEKADSAALKAELRLASAQIYETLASAATEDAGRATGKAAPDAKPSLAEKRKKLADTADFIRSLSEDDYKDVSRGIMRGHNPHMRYFASRSTALQTVYTSLAALEYRAAQDAGLPAEKKQEVETALQTLTADEASLAVNPANLSETGWWQSFNTYVNAEPRYNRSSVTAVAAVRGGRKIQTENDKKIAKLHKKLDAIKASLETEASAEVQAGLYMESAQTYQELASAAVEDAARPVAGAPKAKAPAASSGGEMSPKAVYQRASPAVVLVMCVGGDGNGELGTGSVINDAGQILTNAHVVIRSSTKEPYEKIRIYFKPAHISGDTKRDLVNPYEAKVVSFDRAMDLAVLELDEKPAILTVLPLGDSETVDAGEPVVAIGHPEQGGLWTLTTGVVSTVVSSLGGVKGKDVFQTDASINRGNSGGPLIDRRGALIGVNTSMARKAADGLTITSVNFSIKSSVVKNWLAGAGLGGRYTVMDPSATSEIAAAQPEEAPKAETSVEEKPTAVEKPAVAPKPKAEAPAILTPKKPFKIADVIEQQMAEMEDLEKEMIQEVDKRRGDIESQQAPTNR